MNTQVVRKNEAVNVYQVMTDLWQASCDIDTLRTRARMNNLVREFFLKRHVLEVETNNLSHAATTDPYISSLEVPYAISAATSATTSSSTSHSCYLHTSPEFAMKRLLAMGSGDIYQICKVYRFEESGRLHNPEFTMLEWYRLGMTYHELMREVADLIYSVVADDNFFESEPEYCSYQKLFHKHLDLDPFNVTIEELLNCAKHNDLVVIGELSLDDYLNLLLTHLIEPHLGKDRLTFVYDYPASQASLAKIREPDSSQSDISQDSAVAERFELYIHGMEIANGFQELTDANVQQTRFIKDLQQRKNNKLPDVPFDQYLIDALSSGMPECSGVALGLDRLCMIKNQSKHINDVIAFPFHRS